MEKLNILGTGAAMTLDCYNTCFTLENNEGEHILVDTGGGLQIIKQLRDAKIDFRKYITLFYHINIQTIY